MKHIVLVLLFSLFSFSPFVHSQTKLSVVAVGQAEEEKDIITIFSPFSNVPSKIAKQISNIWKNDLSFYKHKFIVKYNKSVKNLASSPEFMQWKAAQFRYVVTSQFLQDAKSKTTRVNLKVFDTISEKDILNVSELYSGDIRDFAHKYSDQIYNSITKKKSIFTSKIYFVSDKYGTKKKMVKELFVMDFDGRNIKRLTNHRSIVISPSVSHDNKKVVYSVIKVSKGRQNVDLYMLNLETKKISLVSAKKGINSGAVFSQDDERIFLTLSYTGNADIYELVLKTGALRKITKHFSDDVDPSITADGASMSFLSGRPGKAMIYTLDPRGVEKSVKRISYVGKFNATPRYSPDGREIVFSSWVDNKFDIYRIDSKGRNLVRLTKNFGSNEEPSYSKDGEFVAFSSLRVLSRKRAIQNLYIMTRDGEILGNISDNFGTCSSPRWSN
jgi:TolB protein